MSTKNESYKEEGKKEKRHFNNRLMILVQHHHPLPGNVFGEGWGERGPTGIKKLLFNENLDSLWKASLTTLSKNKERKREEKLKVLMPLELNETRIKGLPDEQLYWNLESVALKQ